MTIKGKKFKIVFRRGKPLTKIVLAAMLAVCIVAMVVIRANIARERERLAASEAKAKAQVQKQDELQDKIDKVGSQEGIVDIAGEELGLYDPDTIIVETE